MSIDNAIWAEKYRPTSIEEIILPESTKEIARGLVKSGNLPSLLFTGSAGIGKTTLAKAIANDIGADFMQINASSEGNIDLIRTKLLQFASTVSFTDSKKITLMDECDGLTQSAQQALRGFIEEYSGNHTIIFTCNFESKLIDAIKSRCKKIDFKISNADKVELSTQFLKRVLDILDKEGVQYEKRVVAELVMKKFPDFRSVLNELQGYAAGGKIDAGILLDLSDDMFNQLLVSLKQKKFSEVRRWVAEHADIESATLFRMFYDKASQKIEPKGIPELILLLGEYSYKAAFVPDQEINTMAFLTSIIISDTIQWK
jgi:replication factor C small subunit